MTEPEIRQEIERTRARLGATVEELAARADVTARARDKAVDVAAGVRVKGKATASRLARYRWPLAVMAMGLVTVGASVAVRQRQKA